MLCRLLLLLDFSVFSLAEHFVVFSPCHEQKLDGLQEEAMGSDWLEEEHADQSQVPLKATHCSHEVKKTERLPLMDNNSISHYHLDIKKLFPQVVSFVLGGGPRSIDLPHQVPVMVALALTNLNQIILNLDRVELELSPSIVVPISVKPIRAKVRILAKSRSPIHFLHVKFVAEVLNLHFSFVGKEGRNFLL